MSSKHTSATPANVPRSRSCWTRRQRQEIAANVAEIQAQQDAYREMYGKDDERDWDGVDDTCERCGGEGFVEYMDAPDTHGARTAQAK